jgi:pimeloyl-ACP methyl ester carboxylesterase
VQQSIAQDNADLRALLDAANVRAPYVVVGHSMGALLARRYAGQYPDGIVGMVLVGTRPDPNASTPDEVAGEKAAELEDQPRISSNSKLIRDPSSGHQIYVDNPAWPAPSKRS